MSRRYKSPREALGHMYSFFIGPKWSEQEMMVVQRSTAGDQWDAPAIACLVYGPRPRCMGLVRGSEADLRLRYWATVKGATNEPDVANFARRYEMHLRALLRKNHMLSNRKAILAIFRQHFRDAYSGRPISTVGALDPEGPLVVDVPHEAQDEESSQSP